ncbi:MAG: hypothetical protein WD024_05790 [Bacillota bacterium]
MDAKTTSWTTVGVGAIVSAIGQVMRPSQLGAGIMGFGLAHVVLGLLDMARPTVRERS